LLPAAGDEGRGFRTIVGLLIWLVIIPTTMLIVLGILMLIFWQSQLIFMFGILVMTLLGLMVTGSVLALLALRREAELSKLQLDFVSKVSHELRTPLTSIRMFAETLQMNRTRNSEQMELCLDVLQKETARLSKRIERLLDWGRMEAGRRIYKRHPDTVEALVEEALEAHKPGIVGHDHQIRIELQPRLPRIVVDREAMVDALVNLLSNAFKYTGEDRQIAVIANAGPRNVRISVKDNGIGIPWREHRNIFEKFYRVDERLSSVVEGSGLGLAMVRHVVQAHGGRVELESEPGKGSTFTIVLPRARTAELTKAQEKDTEEAA
jgi:two-component system phosphate regulon sensor histidine kinase PhoR